MDRNLRTTYNLRSLNPSNPVISTSTTSSHNTDNTDQTSGSLASTTSKNDGPQMMGGQHQTVYHHYHQQHHYHHQNHQAQAKTVQAPGVIAPSAIAAAYPHKINGMGGPTATTPFLQDLKLVAEAAKRAQMSVVTRDLESVTL
ncbi:hypothetical protein ASPZODRAFT_135170 [Penicilliopsis zonata CBS 506.65]|uniref:Uncharacterized protein n=1 Tax=Penicilliopsis zonata CBS 506.65 TaxID=1073090 RepID=A0A1L9SB74_9EURO|nr:hypothetical protein ASPZODRAFT_135170 [Penicilliopsis zonata CBS 506.65]OJJ44359.1 hypothetical protein ASPZODRAFT_135170 [Penicilliopsis zonata CBS 506.65]